MVNDLFYIRVLFQYRIRINFLKSLLIQKAMAEDHGNIRLKGKYN